MTDYIADYERYLRRLDRAPSTVALYVRTLRLADRDLPYGLYAASTEELEEWVFTPTATRHGGPQRNKNTRSQYIRHLKGFGRWATDPKRPKLDFDATAELPTIAPPKGKPKPTLEDVLTTLLREVPEPQRLWILLAAYAGLRCCEIAALDRGHVTAERIWLQGKGEKERYVPTHPLIWEAVKGLPAGPVAVDEQGKRLTGVQVAHRGAYRIRKAGCRGTSMHKLRHRFASKTYDATRDLVAVQELLGHSDVSTTRRYVEVNRDRMAAAVASLPVAV